MSTKSAPRSGTFCFVSTNLLQEQLVPRLTGDAWRRRILSVDPCNLKYDPQTELLMPLDVLFRKTSKKTSSLLPLNVFMNYTTELLSWWYTDINHYHFFSCLIIFVEIFWLLFSYYTTPFPALTLLLLGGPLTVSIRQI